MAKKGKQVRKDKKNTKQVVITIVVVLMVIAVLAAVKLQMFSLSKSSPVVAPVLVDTVLSFVPDVITGKAGETKTVDIAISSGKNTVSGVEFKLTPESAIIRIQKASAGTFFDKPAVLANTLSKTGNSLYFAIGSLTPKQGSGTLATLTIRFVKPGSITLSLSDVKIAAINAGSTNVLRSSLPAAITVQ